MDVALYNQIKNKGPVKIVNGKPTDVGLYDMKADDAFDELQKLRIIKQAIREVIQEKKGITESQRDEEILNRFANDILS